MAVIPAAASAPAPTIQTGFASSRLSLTSSQLRMRARATKTPATIASSAPTAVDAPATRRRRLTWSLLHVRMRHAELVVLGDHDLLGIDRAGRAGRVTQDL